MPVTRDFVMQILVVIGIAAFILGTVISIAGNDEYTEHEVVSVNHYALADQNWELGYKRASGIRMNYVEVKYLKNDNLKVLEIPTSQIVIAHRSYLELHTLSSNILFLTKKDYDEVMCR